MSRIQAARFEDAGSSLSPDDTKNVLICHMLNSLQLNKVHQKCCERGSGNDVVFQVSDLFP